MSIHAGTKLGPYEIVSPLGAGGMGEVYRARDPRFGRDVAVKILPSNLSTDPDRLQRFEQEARAAGVLNHPNILSVYDIGRSDASPYLVSELLEGETLRNKLVAAGLPQRKAIDYAQQIARGLSAAHEKGIVHRDLKPENIFITKDGRLKILDFGLAKLTQQETPAGQLTQLPTSPGTEPGVVLGTVGYMSPEQVRGKTADHRSDIFSFGAILYEMLTGHRAFAGESAADTLSAILQKDPPDVSHSNRNIAPALSRIVQHCLEKDVEQRFQSASDIAFDLDSVSGLSDATAVASAIKPRRQMPVAAWKVLSAVALISAVVLGLLYFRLLTKPVKVLQASIEAPAKWSFGGGQPQGLEMSPDGKYIAFPALSEADRKWMLWIRSLDKQSAQMIAESDEASFPFWSPDSEFLAFFAGGKLKKIRRSGGPIQTICDAPEGRGGTWNRNGDIVFTPQPYGPLFRVSATGGTPKAITKVSNPEESHRWPFFLPDSVHFLYTGLGPNGIFVGSIDAQKPKQLNSDASNAEYASSGFILFARGGNLVAQQFDTNKLNLRGEAFPVVQEKIWYDALRAMAVFTTSDDFTLVYRTPDYPTSRPTWFDRSGKEIESFGEAASFAEPNISPNGDRITFARLDPSGKEEIWMYEISTKRATRLTLRPDYYNMARWSPDSNQIVFGLETSIYEKRIGSAAEAQQILRTSQVVRPDDWSPDGRWILMDYQNPRGDWDLWILPMVGDRKPYAFQANPYAEYFGRFSPDGKWIAYMSEAMGPQPEVYVRSFSDATLQWQVSTDTGGQPRWRKDGKELFFVSKDKLMSVDVVQGTELSFSQPKLLYKLPKDVRGGDVSPDGQRVLHLLRTEDTTNPMIRVVSNYSDVLKN